MKFSVGIPNCKEGLSLPLPFADLDGVVRLSQAAEQLGYDSVWANDHITAPAYIGQAYPGSPPRFYEPLITLAHVAAHTTEIRLATGVLVLPMREPAFLAKQIATLDHASRGRVILGVGVGAYREELAALHPKIDTQKRGLMFEESLQALTSLFEEDRSSFSGRFFEFSGIELYPKPLQRPFPIYVGGNHHNQVVRAVRYGQGWLPASIPPRLLRQRIGELEQEAESVGRDPSSVLIAPQAIVCIAPTREEAVKRFTESPFFVHMNTLGTSTLSDVDVATEVVGANLIGSPQDIVDRVGEFERVGVSMIASMTVVSPTLDATIEDIHYFAEQVFPNFTQGRAS